MNRVSIISSTQFPSSEFNLDDLPLYVIGRYQNSDIIACSLPDEPEMAIIIRCTGDVCRKIASKRKKKGLIDKSDLEKLIRVLNN